MILVIATKSESAEDDMQRVKVLMKFPTELKRFCVLFKQRHFISDYHLKDILRPAYLEGSNTLLSRAKGRYLQPI